MDELEKLKTILSRNGYPSDIVNTTLALFCEQKARQREQPAPEKEHKRFLKLPYVGRKCEDFAFKLKQMVNEFFPTVEFNVAYQAPMTLGKMFPFKDKIKDKLDQSMVIYHLTCSCHQSYIGKTQRILAQRMQEHSKDKTSTVWKHLNDNPGHTINFNQPDILDKADNNIKLKIKELLHIHRNNPALNIQLGTQSEYEIKTLIIKVYPQHTDLVK